MLFIYKSLNHYEFDKLQEPQQEEAKLPRKGWKPQVVHNQPRWNSKSIQEE